MDPAVNHHKRIAREACQLLQETTGVKTRLDSIAPVGGGCINDAICLVTGEGKFFVKSSSLAGALATFEAEVEGLEKLSSSAFRVPSVIAKGLSHDGRAILILEWIDRSNSGDHFFEQLGRSLAEMHNSHRNESFGFDKDNFIGATRQPNPWAKNWIEFWRSSRLGFQFRLAVDKGLLDRSIRTRIDRLLERLDTYLVEPEDAASLLHGDLWSGNIMPGPDGEPVLIDPAAYYGHSEAEFGIITLFGGFDLSFFEAYDEVRPRIDGFATRVELYKLYHLLNHLNLFGASYLDPCLKIIKRYS